MPLTASQEVIDRVNKRIDSTLCCRQDGSYAPYVCIICDRFLKPSTLSAIQEEKLKKHEKLFRHDGFANLPRGHRVIADYSYGGENAMDWMKHLLLSPRASYLGLGRGQGSVCGYSACNQCTYALDRNSMPMQSIANKNYFGTPPPALATLNDVELALLTPLKAYGFTFSWSGGTQRCLKGVVSYFRVKEYDVARAVLQLDVIGLNEHIVVLYTGDFTEDQKNKAKEKSTIRVDKVLRAVEWLTLNSRTWSGVSTDEIRRQLLEVGPVVIDESRKVNGAANGVDSNIETTEMFVAYFPDGTMRTVSGGQASIDAFKTLVERSKFHMSQLEFQCFLGREAASDFKDDNFLRACLLQFPYGLGGMNETRMKADGSLTSSVDMIKYVRHLSYISQPHFHRTLFVLILYSIYQRQKMLRSSSLAVRGDVDYRDFATALSADDVDQAVAFRQAQREQRRSGSGGPPIPGGTFLSNKYLNSIDAVTKALPHSNAAAARARTEGECLCHYLGFPSIFLSFAPDDESSFLIQVFSGVTIDDDTRIESLTDEQLAARAKDRRELRIRNPGLCTFNFEIMLEIVLEEIVGIDMKDKHVLGKGFFGLVEAAMVTIEEQGRTTLHAHILLWIKELKEKLRRVQDNNEHDLRRCVTTKRQREQASRQIATRLSDISTTALVGNLGTRRLERLFHHDCSSPYPSVPSDPSNQQLRNLRHKVGCVATEYVFAVCNECQNTWQHEHIVESFLQERIPRFKSYPDKCRRLNAMCVQHQKPGSSGAVDFVVNAAYNTHFSFHTDSCFPCNDKGKCKRTSKKRKRKGDECRMRLPDLKRARACVNEIGESSWYRWDGTCTTKKMIEINPRRGRFDQIQNVSCPVISESKMTCNSNVQILSPGPVVGYCTKYTSKPTQKSETEDYDRVAAETRKMLSDDRKHPDDKKETLRRVLRASFAHNKANVVGPSMASWLTRMGSRFMISKDFAWCPLRDLDLLLKKSSLNLTLRTCHGVSFFESCALHYLCRPLVMEGVDVAQFYTEYEVRYIGRKKSKSNDDDLDEVIPFENTVHFQHPSFKSKTQCMAQGVRSRETPLLLKLHQWYFPDAEKFNGSILDEKTAITPVIEQYSRLVLMLFLPFRCEMDLMLHGSHTRKLRQCVRDNRIRDFAFEYLQNVQDARSNCLRTTAVEDELARQTVPYQAVDDGLLHPEPDGDDDDDSDDDAPNLHNEFLDELLNDIFLSPGDFDDDSPTPSKLNFSSVMEKGSKRCGFDMVADVFFAPSVACGTSSFTRTCPAPPSPASPPTNTDPQQGDSDSTERRFQARQTRSRRQIVRTVLTCRKLRERSFPTFGKDEKPVLVKEANGTAASILDWAIKTKLDKNQMRTFEILASSFVLTFYDDTYRKNRTGAELPQFIREYRKLECLSKRSPKKESLVSFVHGPGGAGKSAVVDLVILYCREYCENLNFPFTSQTIVVTALTGVAATILLGETTHRAVHINRQKDFTAEEIEDWKETRLLIIDEVSFASPRIFQKLDENLRTLRGKLFERYGGLNIVFSGDLQQLKAIKEHSICDVECPQFDEWVNCYTELQGKFRFKRDPMWGELLFRFRDGVPTIEDITKINERVSSNVDGLPPSVRYATHTNKDRDAINTSVFSKYCSSGKDDHTGRVPSALVILSDNLTVKNGKGSYVAVVQRRKFWEGCGEDDVKCKDKRKGRVDPVLKLFRNCPVMLTSNDDVKAGRANGTRALVDHVDLKPGENHFDVSIDGCIVPTVFASQVQRVHLKHENKKILPQLFDMEPRQYSIDAYLPGTNGASTRKADKDKVEMKITQLPITSNIATTGHKLQGSGVDELFVHTWFYEDNWPYVVLSRVTSIRGLFLREPLSYDLKRYTMSPIVRAKIENFRKRKARPVPTEEEYRWIADDDPLESAPNT